MPAFASSFVRRGRTRRARAGLLVAFVGTLACASRGSSELRRAYETASSRLDRAPSPQRRLSDDAGAPRELEVWTQLAVERSPALMALAHRARALVHAGRAEATAPSAELGLEAWNLPLARPYAVGQAEMYMVELRQRFPAAGSLDPKARAAAQEAEAVLAELRTEESRLSASVAESFADAVEAEALRSLEAEQRRILEEMQRAVVARYSTGAKALSDAARLEVELSRTDRAIARANGEVSRSLLTLRALTREEGEAGPMKVPMQLPAVTTKVELEDLRAWAREGRGEAASARAKVLAAKARYESARAEARVPEFMVGLGYWQMPRYRPGFGATVSMSLPWLWGPTRHRLSAAEENAAADLRAGEAIGVTVDREIAEAYGRLRATEAELKVVHQGALPAAERATLAVTAAYTTGGATLLEWLDAQRGVLDLKREELALRAQLLRSVVALERAVGRSLPRMAVVFDEVAP